MPEDAKTHVKARQHGCTEGIAGSTPHVLRDTCVSQGISTSTDAEKRDTARFPSSATTTTDYLTLRLKSSQRSRRLYLCVVLARGDALTWHNERPEPERVRAKSMGHIV